MPTWLLNILVSVGTLILTLTVTLIFNKITGLPKVFKNHKKAAKAKEEQINKENSARDNKISLLEMAVNDLSEIQTQLQRTDTDILTACSEIKNKVIENQQSLDERLDRLEKREKNSIRAKLIDEYRLFTDESKNPMLAWSEMEHHAFFELVKDYEDLHGNDYVHSTIIPAMNKLDIVQVSDRQAFLQLMNSRKL